MNKHKLTKDKMRNSETEIKIKKTKAEINETWFSFWVINVVFAIMFWYLEPFIKTGISQEDKTLMTVHNIIFNYISICLYYVVAVYVCVSLFRKYLQIKRFKKGRL
ncbi:hypothetical protein CN895_07975 [Bacillus cereus]|uniref:hypothetical protein n=1 Tax=Bacillus cereus TaxID=1396 RepID=UPI000BFCD3A4|nr:hypothetical protein [Bacillus cereus]PGK15278.1 hypothetical protein CN895_07975 [Bacillus cereus]